MVQTDAGKMANSVAANGSLPYDISPRLRYATQSWLQSANVSRALTDGWIQRLRRISQYGVLPLVRGDLRAGVATGSRFSHSIAVASLCIGFAHEHTLAAFEGEALAWAGLLHDVGHTPFAHSLESLYRTYVGWDHNEQAAELADQVLRRANLRTEIRSIAVDILQRNHPLSLVLYGTAGLDAFENIARALQLTGRNAWSVFNPEPWIDSEADVFASVKEQLYAALFYEPRYQLFERLFQALVLARQPLEFEAAGRVGDSLLRWLMSRDDSVFQHSACEARQLFAGAARAAVMRPESAEKRVGSYVSLPIKIRRIRAAVGGERFHDHTRVERTLFFLPMPRHALPPRRVLSQLSIEIEDR